LTGKRPAGDRRGRSRDDLLVDDETLVLNVAREMLEALGYRVLCAGSGQEAVAVYLREGQSTW
jgi:CheY-like chemotaxis protein